uniref:Uncharacterized protein n=1 Tax=Candidatus Kentrum eta TaxID=2126337 RepID=A0A450VIH8_9GAMM|nr:MAG: hypothetical protein BECKH772A_GA0070896_102512 [Candidatus Kentron sp. H]VFK04614.1 MAG: hypothetical protein BECKH772B_GA0070898_104662 [Candidatus Kentron sp. H]
MPYEKYDLQVAILSTLGLILGKRLLWVERGASLSVSRQCELAWIPTLSYYAQGKQIVENRHGAAISRTSGWNRVSAIRWG